MRNNIPCAQVVDLDMIRHVKHDKSESAPVGPHLSSLDAGLRVMTMFSSRDTVNLREVSEHLECSRSTAYRILNTLRHRGIVLLGPGGRGYYPGPVLVELSRPRGLDQDDRRRLRPVIEDAVQRSGETVHVATLIGHQILFFDGKEPDRAVRASLRPGYLRPAHAISAGRLLLSYFTDEQVRELYGREQLAKVTPFTLSTVSELIAELERIRIQGYAFNVQGGEVGLAGTAVPLPGRSWRERVALCATVPLDRGDVEGLEVVRDHLKAAATRLTAH